MSLARKRCLRMFSALKSLAWLALGTAYERLSPPRVVLHNEPTVILDDLTAEDVRAWRDGERLSSALRSVVG
jgi:hypothetical protein